MAKIIRDIFSVIGGFFVITWMFFQSFFRPGALGGFSHVYNILGTITLAVCSIVGLIYSAAEAHAFTYYMLVIPFFIYFLITTVMFYVDGHYDMTFIKTHKILSNESLSAAPFGIYGLTLRELNYSYSSPLACFYNKPEVDYDTYAFIIVKLPFFTVGVVNNYLCMNHKFDEDTSNSLSNAFKNRAVKYEKTYNVDAECKQTW
jgi:hypothetical protein